MTKEKLIPELRFPDFEGEIKKYCFNDIFLFLIGKNIKQNEASPEFEIPCVRYGELYYMYKEVIDEVINKTNLDTSELLLSDGDEILLPSAGEDPLDIGSASALTIKNVAIGRTINILKPLKPYVYSHIYVSYYINQKLKKKIASLAKGVSISNVYNSDLKTLEINLPSYSEQTRIATFLTAVDKRITLLTQKKEKLEQYKKGVMQKIFNQEIRFKDEKGREFPEWEEKRLGEVLSYEQPTKYLVESIEYDNKYKIPVVTAGKTFILGYTNESFGIYTNVPAIIFDDFTTASQFVTFPFKAKSSAMKILKANENYNLKFLYEALQMITYEVGGHGRHWISVFEKMKLLVPSYLEQNRIATFLSALDKQIEKADHQIMQMKQWKKGLLQKMFV